MTVGNREANQPLIVWIAAFATGIACYHLLSAWTGYSDYRDIHLGAALEYSKGRIDLLRPVVVGFNATGTPTVQELPLWQAAAALVFKATGSTWFGWANLTSLLVFAAGLWPFFQFAKTALGERGAWWTLLFFLAQPLIIVHAGRAATDGLSLVAMLWFLYSAEQLVRTEALRWWPAAVLFACLTAVSKLPFLMSAGIAACLLLRSSDRARSWRAWALLASVGLVAGVVFLRWTRYTDYTASIAEFPMEELRVGHSSRTAAHFFGDWSYRLNPYNWAKGAWRVSVGTVGTLAMLPLPMAGLLLKGNRWPKFLVVGVFLTTLVFTHLVLVHTHYYLMVCPAIAMLCAAALLRAEQGPLQAWGQLRLFSALAGAVLVLVAIEGMMNCKIVLQFDPYPRHITELLKEHTQPADKLLVQGGSWGGRELFCSGRKGLSVFDTDLAQRCSGKEGQRIVELGFNRLVMISESPLLAALQEVNPGSHYHRYVYPASVSPEVDAWPVLFQNEDILIKGIPRQQLGAPRP